MLKKKRKEIFQVLLDKIPNFIDILPEDFEYSSDLEPIEIVTRFFDKENPVSEETPKRKRKKTPENGGDDAEPEDLWVDPKKAYADAEKALQELTSSKDAGIVVKTPCLHIPNKGPKKNKACNKACDMTAENTNIFFHKMPCL